MDLIDIKIFKVNLRISMKILILIIVIYYKLKKKNNKNNLLKIWNKCLFKIKLCYKHKHKNKYNLQKN